MTASLKLQGIVVVICPLLWVVVSEELPVWQSASLVSLAHNSTYIYIQIVLSFVSEKNLVRMFFLVVFSKVRVYLKVSRIVFACFVWIRCCDV